MGTEAAPHLHGLTGLTIAMPPLSSLTGIKAMPLLFGLTGHRSHTSFTRN